MDAITNTAIAAERGILSSVFSGKPEEFQWFDLLSTEYFHDIRNQLIYAAIHSNYLEGTKPDKLIVESSLAKASLLETAGGVEYIQSLNEDTDSANLLESYVSIIRNNSLKHKISAIADKAKELSGDQKTDPYEDLQTIRRELNKAESLYYSNGLSDIKSNIEELMQLLQIRAENRTNIDGVPSGFMDFDSLTGGFGKGELIILGARPSMGKTGFVLSIANELVLRRNIPVAWFTLELSAQQLVTRMLSIETEIESQKISRGRLTAHELESLRQASDRLKNAPFYLVDEAATKVDRVAMLARKFKEIHGVQLIVVDYLQLMTADRKGRYESREIEIATISRTMKKIARDLNIPIIVMSQLSRAVEARGGDKKPILSDLRESGAIEQDADKVLFLYRAEYYGIDYDSEGNNAKDMAEIIVAKNRFGPVGTAITKFISRFGKFVDFEFPEHYKRPWRDHVAIADEEVRDKFNDIFLRNTKGLEDVPF